MKKSKIFSNFFMIAIIVWMLLPLVATFIYSLFKNWTDIIPTGFSFNSYETLFTNPRFFTALYQTVLLCIVPIIITIIVMLLALFVVTIYFPRLEKYVQILCMIPYTIQGVILSVSILSVYGKSGTVFGERMVMLIGAYCIIILPHIYQGIRNSMHAISMPMLIEAAEMLGASRIYAFFRVIVPNIISGITVSSSCSRNFVRRLRNYKKPFRRRYHQPSDLSVSGDETLHGRIFGSYCYNYASHLCNYCPCALYAEQEHT